MKLKLDPTPQAKEISKGKKLWALTDGENNIQTLTLETSKGHKVVEIKGNDLLGALKKLLK